MQANLENWTIVIIGSWNTKIFNPRWIGEKLFSKPDLQVQVLIPMIPGFPSILSAENIEMIPAEDRLTFRAKIANDAVLLELEEKTVTTLQVLEHTPIRAIGANFGFIENHPPDSVASLFEFSDEERLSKIGWKAVQKNVSRTLQMDDGLVNLILTNSPDGVKAVVNFHLQLDYPKNLENAGQALQFVQGKLLSYKQKALGMLRDVYDLQLEEEEVTV